VLVHPDYATLSTEASPSAPAAPERFTLEQGGILETRITLATTDPEWGLSTSVADRTGRHNGDEIRENIPGGTLFTNTIKSLPPGESTLELTVGSANSVQYRFPVQIRSGETTVFEHTITVPNAQLHITVTRNGEPVSEAGVQYVS